MREVQTPAERSEVVLLLEDNPGDARLLCEMLYECGYLKSQLSQFGTLKDAVQCLENGGVDIIVLDLGLPDSDGLESLLKVRIAAPNVAAIVLTGLNDEEMAVQTLRHGAQDYLVKGDFSKQSLMRSMRKSIERQRMQSQLFLGAEEQNRKLEMRNREVEETTRLKSQFLASMSHELRTPLNSILGFTDLLESQTSGPLNEKQHRFLNHVRTGARHLLQLINDILDLSKIEAGHMELQLAEFDLREVVVETLSDSQLIAMVKRITLSEESTELSITADRFRLKQVLLNLLSNAIKFTPEGGSVKVDCRREDDRVRIMVSDTGIGIRPEDLGVIFDEFRQASATTKGVMEGTGLGLAICRKLVEKHGGDLRVESEVGKGSHFSFTMALAPASMAVQ